MNIIFKPIEECREINKRYNYLNSLIEYYAGREFTIQMFIKCESNNEKSIYFLNDGNDEISKIEESFIRIFAEDSNSSDILHTENRKYIKPKFKIGDMVKFKSVEECIKIDSSISKETIQQYVGMVYFITDYKTENERILYKIQPFAQILFIDDVPECFLEIISENNETDPKTGFKVIKFPNNK